MNIDKDLQALPEADAKRIQRARLAAGRDRVERAAPELLAALEAVINDPGCCGLKVETIRILLVADKLTKGGS